jgi:dinuclear metal center YbgI/SA1388 family protein
MWSDATLRLSLICDELEEVAPKRLAEDYDNVGLLLGAPDAEVYSIAFALEATQPTVEASIKKGADLLVVHHPFLFKPISSIDLSQTTGQIIQKALAGNLAIYVAHTNFDAVTGGMNDALAKTLGFEPTGPIVPSDSESIFKLVTFVPESHIKSVSEAIFAAGAGQIGDYTGCSFRSDGTGTFVPQKNAKPFVGKPGAPSTESETRIEVQVTGKALRGAVRSLVKAHPYEEPAFDVYPLSGQTEGHGHGRLCTLPKPIKLKKLTENVKASLKVRSVRRVGSADQLISQVALCSGSGAFLIPLIRRPESTCLVTGDIKYHDARLAQERGLCLIDAGHFGTEKLFARTMKGLLEKRLAKIVNKRKIAMVTLSGEKEPFIAH